MTPQRSVTTLITLFLLTLSCIAIGTWLCVNNRVLLPAQELLHRQNSTAREQLQRQRVDFVAEKCLHQTEPWGEATWSAMSVVRERRVFVCLVGKAAGTTWLRTLLRLTGNKGAIDLANSGRHTLHGNLGSYIGRFRDMDNAHRSRYLMGHYYKVMFVREPLERLISGYRDKMFRAVDYVGMRKHIKRNFRHNSTAGSEPVTFDEFVRYVLWEYDNKRVDVHWRPQYDVCRPCQIKYDYIGYYETMKQDAEDVLTKIAGADSAVQFPLGDFDSKVPNSSTFLRLFQNVTTRDVRRLLDFYRNDYKVFGYKIPDSIQRRLQDDNV